MTIQELQRLVTHLSNGGWCRWWSHFNHPQNPVRMAIQVLDVTHKGFFKPDQVHGIYDKGFKLDKDNGTYIYVIDRTNEDGTPYESKL